MNMTKFLAAGVALVSTAALAEGIASANVVGYSQNTLRKDATMVTAQFVGVGTDGSFSLDDIVPQGADVVDQVYLQTLNAYGQTVDTYYWANVDGEDCWTDDNYTSKVSATFTAGDGLWVNARSDTQTIQNAGQVGVKDVEILLRKDATACGNPFPVAVDLQDIEVKGEGALDNVYIQILDQYGKTTATYYWTEIDDAKCWTDDEYAAPVAGVKFAPGEGLWVNARSADQTIVFPAPEL